jgi:DNA-directed RNA polymerase subunit RPC12/RpoP
LDISKSISCPSCKGKSFLAKYEATYVYTYKINTPTAESSISESQNLPFLFDSRDQSSSRQYIECQNCGAKYPCSFNLGNNNIDFTILRKAIRGDHVTTPEFLG